MILGIDVGNTNVVLGLLEDGMLRLVLSDEGGEAMVLYLSPLGELEL